jgi:hypothetical protein
MWSKITFHVPLKGDDHTLQAHIYIYTGTSEDIQPQNTLYMWREIEYHPKYHSYIRTTKNNRIESIYSSTSRSPFESQLHYKFTTPTQNIPFTSARKHIHTIRHDYYIGLKKTQHPKQNYNTNKSEKINHFHGHLDGLKHRQIRSRHPIVNLKSPFRKVLY